MSYTQEITDRIIQEYVCNPSRETVDRLAEEINKTPKSVIAKLSSAGVYKPPKRTTKSGDIIIRKEDMAKQIGEWFGLEVPSLSKAAKLELLSLYKALQDPVVVRAHLVDLEYDSGQD